MFNNIVFIFSDPRWSKVFWSAVVVISIYKIVPWRVWTFHTINFIFVDALPVVKTVLKSTLKPYVASGIIATITAWLSNRADAARNWNVLRTVNGWALDTKGLVDGIPNWASWKELTHANAFTEKFLAYSVDPANGLIITDRIADTIEITAGLSVIVFAYYARDKVIKMVVWTYEVWTDENKKIQKEKKAQPARQKLVA